MGQVKTRCVFNFQKQTHYPPKVCFVVIPAFLVIPAQAGIGSIKLPLIITIKAARCTALLRPYSGLRQNDKKSVGMTRRHAQMARHIHLDPGSVAGMTRKVGMTMKAVYALFYFTNIDAHVMCDFQQRIIHRHICVRCHQC